MFRLKKNPEIRKQCKHFTERMKTKQSAMKVESNLWKDRVMNEGDNPSF
jgi:hypothetical protein